MNTREVQAALSLLGYYEAAIDDLWQAAAQL